MTRIKLNNKGVSLVEALVASVILVIGALLLTSGFLASNKLMERSRQMESGGQQAAGVANGGNGGATVTDKPSGDVTMKIAGQEFVIKGGKVQQYTSNGGDGTTVYRYLPPTP